MAAETPPGKARRAASSNSGEQELTEAGAGQLAREPAQLLALLA